MTYWPTQILAILFSLLGFRSTDSFDREEVKKSAELYCERLINYSYCNPEDQNQRREKVFLLFGENATQVPHLFDLFGSESGNTLNRYLMCISNQPYQSHLQVEFPKINVLDCVFTTSQGEQIVFVAVRKTLKFGNKEKAIPEVIAINLSSHVAIEGVKMHPIYTVLYPSEITIKCNLPDVKEAASTQIGYFTVLADSNMNKENYFLASKYYESALKYDPDNAMIKQSLVLCGNKINSYSLFKEANQFLIAEEFEICKQICDKIILEYPLQAQSGEELLARCKGKISEYNFSYYIKLADELFGKKFYDKAKLYFEKAESFKENDQYCTSMITKCKFADKTKTQNEIQNARHLIGLQKKKYFPEIVKTLSYYEPSGLLEATDYYNLAAILDVGYSEVNKAMQYSKDQSFHLAKEYCLIAMSKGSTSAGTLWYDRFNNKSRHE